MGGVVVEEEAVDDPPSAPSRGRMKVTAAEKACLRRWMSTSLAAAGAAGGGGGVAAGAGGAAVSSPPVKKACTEKVATASEGSSDLDPPSEREGWGWGEVTEEEVRAEGKPDPSEREETGPTLPASSKVLSLSAVERDISNWLGSSRIPAPGRDEEERGRVDPPLGVVN